MSQFNHIDINTIWDNSFFEQGEYLADKEIERFRQFCILFYWYFFNLILNTLNVKLTRSCQENRN
ncbi:MULTISPECIES: hypothetical protein [Moraxella]|uniref:Uncharacterized protein n=1 Tax=Moraxella lacunata TaxID=477 RepID=A0A1B8Q432_MORLA|nr:MULTISPECIES: hypothetical protein [Moraxella]MBE9579008.1 hypothetical protein [Moraxella sp. K1664]MBE9588351.1 hypothetical protein [Moraxella sp. K1630]MBE9596507.1 hypothetical protein [Moraxella sp. K2450]MDH9218896.1 hypothetical protein [Moraxella lacunata]MDI4483057.1 hypothetical protein [Moraxella lacunata]